jgi:hypothetical protein
MIPGKKLAKGMVVRHQKPTKKCPHCCYPSGMAVGGREVKKCEASTEETYKSTLFAFKSILFLMGKFKPWLTGNSLW